VGSHTGFSKVWINVVHDDIVAEFWADGRPERPGGDLGQPGDGTTFNGEPDQKLPGPTVANLT